MVRTPGCKTNPICLLMKGFAVFKSSSWWMRVAPIWNVCYQRSKTTTRRYRLEDYKCLSDREVKCFTPVIPPVIPDATRNNVPLQVERSCEGTFITPRILPAATVRGAVKEYTAAPPPLCRYACECVPEYRSLTRNAGISMTATTYWSELAKKNSDSGINQTTPTTRCCEMLKTKSKFGVQIWS